MISCQSSGTVTESDQRKPNVIFVLADDLGWAQTGAYGSDYYQTPNIDRLAEEGMRFTDAYTAAAICSPTRASVMTGKYPARLHITDFIPGNNSSNRPLTQPDWQKHLPLEEYTLGNLFGDQGYVTAMFGKWHLSPEKFGPASLPFYPDKQGFDHYFVIDKPDKSTDPNLDPHSSDSIGNTSVKFIRDNADKPFFLFMSFSAIHDPLVENADSIARWKNVPGTSKPENNPFIAPILSRMDRNVGKVMNVVDELNLSKNTIIIFYSDNGGLAEGNTVFHTADKEMRMAKQTPLRKGKGWFYEGGIRVPLIIRWEGAIGKGIESSQPVSSIDFMPTFCELLETDTSPETDGISLLSHIKSEVPLQERSLYWHYPHYHGTGMVPAGALRSGKWKFIEWYEKSLLQGGESAFELYDLENDISESTNLADSLHEITQQLSEDLVRWRHDVKAQMPVPNNAILRNR
ncbi:MAG: sulfatase [Cyclobacteriaceae bacterium]|nr:sulfatase [Cyclobacteriaceae bacterium]